MASTFVTQNCTKTEILLLKNRAIFMTNITTEEQSVHYINSLCVYFILVKMFTQQKILIYQAHFLRTRQRLLRN